MLRPPGRMRKTPSRAYDARLAGRGHVSYAVCRWRGLNGGAVQRTRARRASVSGTGRAAGRGTATRSSPALRPCPNLFRRGPPFHAAEAATAATYSAGTSPFLIAHSTA
jgi:hypothetical protein